MSMRQALLAYPRYMAGILDVKFGALDAESERNLSGFFVDTGVLAKLANGSRYLVLGRKGSGKTALFRLAQSQQLRHLAVVDVEFTKYPWEFHRKLKQSGIPTEM
jgi:ABC-type multidrug transport system ATPase subunit